MQDIERVFELQVDTYDDLSDLYTVNLKCPQTRKRLSKSS